MHYDLRLELDGVLKSWAVPNGFSADSADKRLAVMTEDHPFEYLSWEGVIPKGNYGAGEMIVWDHGTFWPEEDNQPPPATREESAARFREGVRKGRMKLTFEGQKLRGSWNLVKSSRSTKDWLLIRRSGGPPPRLDDERSVLSGLTLADLRAGRTTPTAQPNLADVPGAKKVPFPREMEPMNANPAAKPFVHPDWIFEPKLDGYRAFAFVKPGEVRLTSRRGNDTTSLYPAIEDELAALGREMVLDGEVVALDEAGRPTIQALTTQLEGIRRAYHRSARAQFPLLYYAFDLLYLDGYDLRGVQLEGRKRLLREALTPGRTVKLMSISRTTASPRTRPLSRWGSRGWSASTAAPCTSRAVARHSG